MFYLALFIICGIGPINSWTGDRDSGPTCVVAERVELSTLEQCQFRLEDTLQQVRTYAEQQRLATFLKGPYTYEMSCKMTVDQGMLDCIDCPKETEDNHE